MSEARPLVLIIGGAGVFGAHLCRRLAKLKLSRILIGGRTKQNRDGLIEAVLNLDAQCEARFVQIDRDTLTAQNLRELGIFAVVDAAGPFQGSGYGVVEAAIEAGVHYIDLCDARAFVQGIGAFDAGAKAAGVAVLTGASSTPALSNAMLRDLVEGWRSIDRIEVSILPGNKAPRGRSVMQAILSWAGNPVRVFDDGRWQEQIGWLGQRKISLGGLGCRWSSLAETPDLDVLVTEFKPRVSARFHAGLELGLMHNGLRFLAWLRWHRLLPNLTVFTSVLFWIAQRLGQFGTDTGGMVVEAIGIDRDGEAVRATARILALNGDGPAIPTLSAVALLKQLINGHLDFHGASHAGRHVSSQDVLALVPDLAISLETDITRLSVPLFKTVLDDKFALMPEVTQRLHRGAPAVFGEGQATISEPDTLLGRWISALFGFPKPGKDVPVSVLVEQIGTNERWVRRYPGRDMVSVMGNADAKLHTLEETFGPLSFRMRITTQDLGLDMQMISARIGPIPLPRFLVPDVVAGERVDEHGRHLFDVSIRLPQVGRIVHYRGWLNLS